jgi:hypothetical protein
MVALAPSPSAPGTNAAVVPDMRNGGLSIPGLNLPVEFWIGLGVLVGMLWLVRRFA